MIFKMKKTLQYLVVLSSIILINGVQVTEEELNSFSYGPSQFKLAIIGDSGAVREASDVMKLTSFDALLHLGDFDYECKPDAYFDKILTSSRNYQFMGVIGNHDAKGECGSDAAKRFRDNVYREMTNSKNSRTECEFSSSKLMWSCRYNNMRIIGITPAISGADSRSDQLRFLKKHLSSATEDWKICAWHFYDKYYHTGKYQQYGNIVSGDGGESFYDYCKEHGAIIFSAHDHVYARTRVMSKFKSPEIDRYDNKYGSHIVQIRNGATLNILNGAGGWEMYEEKGEQKYYKHWQKKYAIGEHKENEKRFGGLFCKFNVGGNNKKAYCEFLRINSSDKLFDSFTIYRNDNPSTVSYSGIDDNFKNEKMKAYLASKGIIDPSLASNNNTTSQSEAVNPSVDDINIITNDNYEDEDGNYEGSKSISSNELKSKSVLAKTGIIIGSIAGAVIAITAGGLITFKMKKKKHSKDDPELNMESLEEDNNYRKRIAANDSPKSISLVKEEFVPIPMPSYFYDYSNDQFTPSDSKYNKYL